VQEACEPPVGYVNEHPDCNDADSTSTNGVAIKLKEQLVDAG
jgi:hypothetical protein